MRADMQIRLLYLSPCSRGSDLRCDLASHDFYSSPTYETLSYSWGPRNKREVIQVNELKHFQVTDNLAAALRRLRLPGQSRVLWVDAICIDQSSNEEKSIQVGNMGDIYARASRTLLWLGDGVESAHGPQYTVVAFIGMALLWLISFFLGRPSRETPKSPDADRLQDLRHALCNTIPSWWERLWTAQEVVRSQDLPDICFGPWQLRWHEFKPLVNKLAMSPRVVDILRRDKHGRTLDIDPKSLNLRAWMLEKRLEELEELHMAYSRRRVATLLDLAYLNERSMVTDQRDRVYSLLSMVQKEEAMMYKIDYKNSTSAQQVFARTTYDIIKRTRSLQVLEYVSASTSHDRLMPTWALDLATRTISWVNIAGSRLEPKHRQVPDAGKMAEPHLTEDSLVLTVAGESIDVVIAVYPLGQGMNNPLFLGNSSNWSEEIGRHPDGSQYWIGNSKGKINFVWEYSPSLLRARSLTAQGGPRDGPFRSTADGILDHVFDNWLRFSAGLKMRHKGGVPRDAAYWWNHLRRGHVRGNDYVGVHPSFYVTGKGNIGIGARNTKQGDLVVALHGAPSLCLLRSRFSRQYEFQGFTYMNMTKQIGSPFEPPWPLNRGEVPVTQSFNLV